MLQTFLPTFWQTLYQDVKANPYSLYGSEIQLLPLDAELSDNAIDSILNNLTLANLLRFEPSFNGDLNTIRLFLKKLPYYELLQANPLDSAISTSKNYLTTNILNSYALTFNELVPAPEIVPAFLNQQLPNLNQIEQESLEIDQLPESESINQSSQFLQGQSISQVPQTPQEQQTPQVPQTPQEQQTPQTLQVTTTVNMQNPDSLPVGISLTDLDFEFNTSLKDETLININLPTNNVPALNYQAGFALNIQQQKNQFKLQQEKRQKQLQLNSLIQQKQMQEQQKQMLRLNLTQKRNNSSATSKFLKRFVAVSVLGGTATVSGITAFQTLFL